MDTVKNDMLAHGFKILAENAHTLVGAKGKAPYEAVIFFDKLEGKEASHVYRGNDCIEAYDHIMEFVGKVKAGKRICGRKKLIPLKDINMPGSPKLSDEKGEQLISVICVEEE